MNKNHRNRKTRPKEDASLFYAESGSGILNFWNIFPRQWPASA